MPISEAIQNAQIICVPGLPFSGVSLILRGLQALGISLDEAMEGTDELNLIQASQDSEIHQFNAELMDVLAHDWHLIRPLHPDAVELLTHHGYRWRAIEWLRRAMADQPYVVLADVHLAKLLPFWQTVLTSGQFPTVYIWPLRHPGDFSQDLAKWQGCDREQGVLLWLHHTVHTLRVLQPTNALIMDYDRLGRSPTTELMRLAQKLQLQLAPTHLEQFKAECAAIQAQRGLPPHATLPKLVRDVYEKTLALTADECAIADAEITTQLATWETEIADLAGAIAIADQLTQTVDQTTHHLVERDTQISHLLEQLAAKENSLQALIGQVNERDEQLQLLGDKLQTITTSKSWQIAKFLNRILNFISLPTSVQTSWLSKPVALILSPLQKEKNKRLEREISLIRDSALFEAQWYLENNPDVAQAGIDPARHYFLTGGFEGRDPGPKFSSRWYLSRYADIGIANLNPLWHYLKYGKNEGRLPRPVGQSNAGIQGNDGTGPVFDPSPMSPSQKFGIVPYYLNPYEARSPLPDQLNIGIHLHLTTTDALDICVTYLQNIPVPFALYLSLATAADTDAIAPKLQDKLAHLSALTIRTVPDQIHGIAPLIVEFGEQLLAHDFIAHIPVTNQADESPTSEWDKSMQALFGTADFLHQIFQLLHHDARLIYPAPDFVQLTEQCGWGPNFPLARNLAMTFLGQTLQPDEAIPLPQALTFWARSSVLAECLQLPFEYRDFGAQSTPESPLLGQVLAHLLPIAVHQHPGRTYCLRTAYSLHREPAYETHHCYTEKIIHQTVKVLAYYLPQFYPIPENDLWHGKGFTEWNKVRTANPLFYGHDQQRAPHADIGYYTLSTTEVLHQQAQWMKEAGVYGQIFYHYWFSGKLILEKPTQMLLSDPSIDIPFCFCWANENWTRKWDGNESEILLKQDYSEADAIAFIRYLIPFFKDDRYIRINQRPVLFIYRPTSIPDFAVYQTAWQTVCAQHDIPAPYVVAVLTRGAKSPADFGMDAGCERVLHDWTGGAVPDIKETLQPYHAVNGSVLDYGAVADFYMDQAIAPDFTYFRSLIPSWDNTPRYGSDAYIIHNSTPQKFQAWLEFLIQDAATRLPPDQQFVVLNAWNEWAESAILDPDTRFGYAYLNAIGRALSGIPYNSREYLWATLSPTLTVTLNFSDAALSALQKSSAEQKRKFFTCLGASTLFKTCKLMFGQPQVQACWLATVPMPPTGELETPVSDYTLHINQLCYFAPEGLENMLKMALCYDAGVVFASTLNDATFDHADLTTRWEKTNLEASTWPALLLEKHGPKRSTKCCVDAGVFITDVDTLPPAALPIVSTIIRFHRLGHLELLQNALYSLIAQNDCIVQPIIAAQDLTDQDRQDLQELLDTLPWHPDYPPIIQLYHSNHEQPDLRSVMLNETIRTVKTQYVAFLDYDDLLFPNAYAWLTYRLRKTGKNAAFGLIYSTVSSLQEKTIKERFVVYDYGRNYQDFLQRNHTPIHGFMLDLTKVDLDAIHYYPNMKYMEDYYFTLQIFTEHDTDWASLWERQFIGDYYHYEDKSQTLAHIKGDERSDLIARPDYRICDERIMALRSHLGMTTQGSPLVRHLI